MPGPRWRVNPPDTGGGCWASWRPTGACRSSASTDPDLGCAKDEDLTLDKTDEKDAVLIARLTAQLRCYVPEPVDETWGRLRHLGARRERLIDEPGA